jgi:hypothetical protein
MLAKEARLLSKSPESETTTVPVCLSWSRELDMVVVERERKDVGADQRKR